MPIRPNPFASVTWRTTAGATEATSADDDFVARRRTVTCCVWRRWTACRRQSALATCDKKWWWQVYGPDREEVIDSPWMMETMEDAFTIAETVYVVHRRASR